MTTLDLVLALLAQVFIYAIYTWSRIRTREIEVKMDKLRFGREQLQFAQRQYFELAQARADQIKALGNLVPGASPFMPSQGGNNIQ